MVHSRAPRHRFLVASVLKMAIPVLLGGSLLTLGLPAVAFAEQAGTIQSQGLWKRIAGPDVYLHSTTSLDSGQLLVAGGCKGPFAGQKDGPGDKGGCSPLTSTLLYSPSSNTWKSGAPMRVPRVGHTATKMPDGRVLVAGGYHCYQFQPLTGQCPAGGVPGSTSSKQLGDQNKPTEFAEIYDPSSNTWVPAPPIVSSRPAVDDPINGLIGLSGLLVSHTAMMLPRGPSSVCGAKCGKVLLLGITSGAELYDPKAGSWSNAAPHAPHLFHTTTLLKNGKVLLLSGFPPSQSYDPAADKWSDSPMKMVTTSLNSASLLPDGDVLAAGGVKGVTATGASEIFARNVAGGQGAWRPAGVMAQGRFLHTATVLKSGAVLVVGGTTVVSRSISPSARLASAELYDLRSRKWLPAGSMSRARGFFGEAGREGLAFAVPFTSTLLQDGRVLVVGGADKSAEIYDPQVGPSAKRASYRKLGPGRILLISAALAFTLLLVFALRKRASSE